MAAPLTVTTKRLRLGEVRLLEVNARFMRHETFAALVANIRRDGGLTSVPFAVWDGDAYLVLSGNHRVKAGIEALGVDHETEFLVTDDELDPARRVAIQLSHNAIAGEDDPEILRRLYEELEDIDWRQYSGLDDQQLALMADTAMPALTIPRLDYQPVTLVFLPEEVTQAESAWEDAKAMLPNKHAWLARWAEYDRFLSAVSETSAAYDVRNIATALMLVLAVYERHRDDLTAGFLDEEGEAKHKGWVPLSTIFGNDRVPPGAASVIRRAVAKMRDDGVVTDRNLWAVLELWAADYLAS